jgi:hypothetical protein
MREGGSICIYNFHPHVFHVGSGRNKRLFNVQNEFAAYMAVFAEFVGLTGLLQWEDAIKMDF